MTNRDILAIGTSAGGVEALIALAGGLPADFPAAILVTLHIPGHRHSELDEIIARNGRLPARFVEEGDALKKGQFHIAPPDRHMLIEHDTVVLGNGPRENNTRPAIDPMLRSVAICCASRTVGVVLTGTMSDGASGLWALHRCGAITVVQDPSDAKFADMPINALNRVKPDHVVTLAAMPRLLVSLAAEAAGATMPVPDSIRFEVDVARGRPSGIPDMDRLGRRSMLACPDCHGVMWELDEGELVRYRCHVGHAYTAEMMAVALDENVRRGLGSAHRALQERSTLARKLEREAEQNGQPMLAASWARRAQEFEKELGIIRDAIRRLDDIAVRNGIRSAAE